MDQPQLHDALDSIAMAASRPGRDAAATLALIATQATGPLSDIGLRQLGAALADVVAHHPSGVLRYADQAALAERFRQRLRAHGVLIGEVAR